MFFFKIKNYFVSNRYKCRNCKFIIPKWIVKKCKFNVCPYCGNLYPQTIEYLENYFQIIQLSDKLMKAKDLLLKAEFEASVRESVIIYESLVKKKADLPNLLGSDLMSKAFSFKCNQSGEVTDFPRIRINELLTLSEKNEQEGIKFISMGVMQGIRNIYVHGSASSRIYTALQIISFMDLLVKEVYGASLTQN